MQRFAMLGLILLWGSLSPALAQDPEPLDTRPLLALDAGGHTTKVWRVLFTRDGHEAISVSDDKTIRIWDVHTGECVRTLRPPIGLGNGGKLYAAAVSPDGKTLVTGGYGYQNTHPLHVISLTNGEVLRTIAPHSGTTYNVAFSPDGQRVLQGTFDGFAQIINVHTGDIEHILQVHQQPIYGVAWSPRGDRCITGSFDKTAIIWDTATGKALVTLKGHEKEVQAVDWSANGKLILTSGYDNTVRTWTPEGRLVNTYKQFPAPVTAAVFTPDAQKILYGMEMTGPHCAGALDLQTGDVFPYNGVDDTVVGMAVSRDGKLAVTGSATGAVALWKPDTRETVHLMAGGGKRIFAVGWSKDGSTLAWGESPDDVNLLSRTFSLTNLEFGDAPDDTFLRHKTEQGTSKMLFANEQYTAIDVFRNDQKLSLLEMLTDYDKANNIIRCATFVSGDRAVVGAAWGLYLYDVRSGQRLREFLGHAGEVRDVCPAPDGRYFLTGSSDRTLRVWDLDQEEPLLSLFVADTEWIAWTPQGFYAASAGGERLMGWHVNSTLDAMAQFFPAAQFRKTLYKPQVVKLLMRTGSVDRALELVGTEKTDVGEVLPPTVIITTPDRAKAAVKDAEITVRAVARQVGDHAITSLQVILDGRPLGGKTGKVVIEQAEDEVRREFKVPLSVGKHTIVVRADSDVSHGLSTPIEVTYQPPTVQQEKLPTLYVLAMGVAQYDDQALKLKYAAKDAQKIDEAFRANAEGVYQKVVTKVVVDKDASRTGVLTGLTWLKKQMTQHDIGIVFFSGHGDKDDTGNFYLLPCDVDRENLVVTAVSDAQIKGILQGIPGRLMILLDACHAGSLDGDKRKNSRSLTDDLVRDLSNDDYGVVVMASSMGREFSLESNAHQNGYFTVAVAEGLSGHEQADPNKDGLIYFNELDAFVSDRVKVLTDGKQHPVTSKPATIRPFPLTRRK